MEKSFTTNNKISVYTYTNEHLHGFCLSLYLKAGPMYEPENYNGVSHLLEHLVFRNLNNGLMDGRLYDELDRLGFEFKGSTYKHHINLRVIGVAGRFCQAAEILTKVFEPLSLPGREIQLEKSRIKAEIREDDERTTLWYWANQLVWEGCSLKQSVLGKCTAINRLSKRTLEQAYRQAFHTNNLFFYITGKVQEEELRHLTRCLERYSLEHANTPWENCAPVPPSFFHRNCRVELRRSYYCMICFCFDVDTSRYSPAQLDLLYGVLFSNTTCKFYQDLSEKTGLIYSYDATFEQYRNVGNLNFHFEVRAEELLRAVAITVEILNSAKKDVSRELALAKVYYVDNAEMRLDEMETLNFNMAHDRHFLNADFASVAQGRASYQAVTSEQIEQLAREVFTPDNLVVAIKQDKPCFSKQDVRNLLLQLGD